MYTYITHGSKCGTFPAQETKKKKVLFLTIILPFNDYYFKLLLSDICHLKLVLLNLKIQIMKSYSIYFFGACLLSQKIIYEIDPCYFCGCSLFFFIVLLHSILKHNATLYVYSAFDGYLSSIPILFYEYSFSCHLVDKCTNFYLVYN